MISNFIQKIIFLPNTFRIILVIERGFSLLEKKQKIYKRWENI